MVCALFSLANPRSLGPRDKPEDDEIVEPEDDEIVEPDDGESVEREDPHHATASSTILNLEPVAAAYFRSVDVDGRTRPLSSLATTLCVVCIRSASSACVSQARFRASIRFPASENSSSSASYSARYSGSESHFSCSSLTLVI
jgi:hypothetical protein